MASKRKHWTAAWAKFGPCEHFLAAAKKTKSITEFWRTCERGDWMLWMAGKTCGDDRRQLVLAACKCARLALPYVKAGETRPLAAIETAERWARREKGVSIDDVQRAADAAYAAANSAANSAAYAAANAANAAYAATFKQCANIVREFFPKPPRVK